MGVYGIDMAQSQGGSVVSVRHKAAGNSHVEAVDEGARHLFVHFQQTVTTGSGIDRIAPADVHQFVGMAVCTADLTLRRIEEHESGWDVVLEKE